MGLYTTDPFADRRWDDLATSHPKACVFHQRGWLEALYRTYGYRPFVLTSTPQGRPLTDGMVLCRVSSWITGTRAVSLPFTDHCEPLVDDGATSLEFANWLRAECDRQQWKYVEVRPLSLGGESVCTLPRSRSYWFHTLDLTPTLELIFRRLHKDSIQRRIRRAERERLAHEIGRSEQLLYEFYGLMTKTRKRHRSLPQPRAWFRNLVDCMGEKVQVSLARKDGVPIAAMLTLRHRSCIVYKYGCSDERFHNLGGMPFLFWKLIEEGKALGAEEIDLGRSDIDNAGLITFKDRLDTRRRLLTYHRHPDREAEAMATSRHFRAIGQFFSILPDCVSSTFGTVLYKHMG